LIWYQLIFNFLLSLTLLVLWVLFVDNINPSFATYNYAVGRSFFNAGSDFHALDRLLVFTLQASPYYL